MVGAPPSARSLPTVAAVQRHIVRVLPCFWSLRLLAAS